MIFSFLIKSNIDENLLTYVCGSSEVIISNFRASEWKSRETILYICDLRVRYSGFHRSSIGTVISRTVITEHPKGIEVRALKEFAKSQPVTDQAMAEMLSTNAHIDRKACFPLKYLPMFQ